MDLNFLKLKKYEDYLDLLKKSERCRLIKDYYDPNYDNLINKIVEEAFRKVYLNQFKKQGVVDKRKKKGEDSQDWSSAIKKIF